MSQDDKKTGGFLAATLLVCSALVVSGCQAWHSSAAIPGLTTTTGERKVLRQAKNDPFPSPADVGMADVE